jgi:L-ribulose-5-phosphate 4-epimerase
MDDEMILGDYEYQTGYQIINCFKQKNIDYEQVEMVLVGNHAPFTWGKNAEKALYNSAILEYIAKLALNTEQIAPKVERLKNSLKNKHYQRKHGSNSYYGQYKVNNEII